MRLEKNEILSSERDLNIGFNKEFDPGSGRTLAARLTHASRTELIFLKFSDGREINLVANG